MPVTDLKVKAAEKDSPKKPPSRSRIEFDPGVATVFRKICRYEHVTADAMLDMLIRYWVTAERPQLELVEDPSADYEPLKSPRRGASPFRDTHTAFEGYVTETPGSRSSEQRTGPPTRRKTRRRGTEKPIPGSNKPNINRRKKSERRTGPASRRKKDAT